MDRERLRLIAATVLAMLLVLGALLGSIAWGLGADRPAPSEASRSEPTAVDELHERGVTGSNVTVGVVSATGVDPSAAGVDDRVVAARAFGTDGVVPASESARHGTATAATVADVAPDAEFYLASFDAATDFTAALRWMRRSNVDVIVAPVSLYARTDGDADVNRAIERTVAAGSIVVVPAGNVGLSHWRGEFAPNRTGTHRFAGGPRTYLRGEDSRVSVWLSWNRSVAPTRAEQTGEDESPSPPFSVELYRETERGSRLVGRSVPYHPSDGRTVRLSRRVDPTGTYFVTIRGPRDPDPVALRLLSPTHTLQYRDRAGSLVAPGDAQRAITVGAWDPRRERVHRYSGAGSTADGRTGVDVVAPSPLEAPPVAAEFDGTSAASAYVAGVAALVRSANPDLAPRQVNAVLAATAGDVGPAGRDPVSGYGVVAPNAAVGRARNLST
ncbi:S8 family serine peptidase [Halobaculum magnesiiphilum]|nr:S8 family serine peptidase [Halobaculum magnesiiphilum]